MPSEYCTEADLYSYGLPRGSLTNPGRLVSSANVATSALTLNVHGFVTGDAVRVRPETQSTLPAPLAEGVTYYAIALDADRFQLSLSIGGAPIILTSTGTGRTVVVAAGLPVSSAIRWASALIDEHLPAHIVPLADPIPEIVRATCAELAAHKLLARTGTTTESLSKTMDEAMKRLARWARGIPLRGPDAPAERANTAVSSASARYVDRRGWGRYGGIG